MEIAVVICNLALTFVFSGSFLPEIGFIVGTIYTIISGIGTFYLRDKEAGIKFINSHLVALDDGIHDEKEKVILLSAAFMAVGMKIGTALGLAVGFGMVAILAFCILLATGYIIEGSGSGMTAKGAWQIAKLIIWIYNKLNGLYEFIAKCIVKLEFHILKIDIKNKEKWDL